jgi:ammonium transporter, Amt family
MSGGDSALMLTSTAVGLFMVRALALFYGGLVGQKNVIAMMAESFVAIGIVTVVWVVGYSLAFAGDPSGLIGGFSHVMLRGLGATPSAWDPHVPGLLFIVYQAMLAVITPALIAGAFTGRMHVRGDLAFIVLWSLVIYAPLPTRYGAVVSSGLRGWARSTSPAERWFTRRLPRARWPGVSISDGGGTSIGLTTCRW